MVGDQIEHGVEGGVARDGGKVNSFGGNVTNDPILVKRDRVVDEPSSHDAGRVGPDLAGNRACPGEKRANRNDPRGREPKRHEGTYNSHNKLYNRIGNAKIRRNYAIEN